MQINCVFIFMSLLSHLAWSQVGTKTEYLSQEDLNLKIEKVAVAGVIDRGDIVQALAEKLNLPIDAAEIRRIKEEGSFPPGLQLGVIAKSLDK